MSSEEITNDKDDNDHEDTKMTPPIIETLLKCSYDLVSKIKQMKPFDIPPHYHHLGFASNLSGLKSLIEQRFPNVVNSKEFQIGFYEIILSTDFCKDSCEPYKTVFQKLPNEKITIFYKISDCALHKYIVVCIIGHNFIEKCDLDKLEEQLFNHILPKLKYTVRKSTNDLPIKGKKKLRCDCNPLGGGGTRSFGCGTSPANCTSCKFFKIPAQGGRLKFDLELKRKTDDIACKDVCTLACDIATDFVRQAAPECYQNMSTFFSDASKCRIGSKEVNIFAGVTLVADYTAHSHVDYRDYHLSSAAVLSIQNKNQDPKTKNQLHYLPMYTLRGSEGPGFAFDLGHGSILLECAARETHGTTKVVNANGRNPKRVGIVCFTHASLNKNDHGSKQN